MSIGFTYLQMVLFNNGSNNLNELSYMECVECVKIELNGGQFVVGGKNDGR
jgi:hypothetical protein